MIENDASVEVRRDHVEKLLKIEDEVKTRLKEIGFEKVEIDSRGYYEGRMNG